MKNPDIKGTNKRPNVTNAFCRGSRMDFRGADAKVMRQENQRSGGSEI